VEQREVLDLRALLTGLHFEALLDPLVGGQRIGMRA
jgi:hypothetical protein